MNPIPLINYPCAVCWKPTSMWCSRCQTAWYCSPEHLSNAVSSPRFSSQPLTASAVSRVDGAWRSKSDQAVGSGISSSENVWLATGSSPDTTRPRKREDDPRAYPRMIQKLCKQHVWREMLVDVPINDIQSNFPHDLTGHVTISSGFPFASGSYGDIYRGNLNVRGKSVDIAIKTCKLYLQHDEQLAKKMKRFRRELTVWLKLKHPNILPLLGTIRDSSMHPNIPAMVCPWVENGSLSTYLERSNNLAVAKKIVLVNDVARGLQYLHSQDIVHGDLSGSNVLIYADGSACIADFGLSTLLTQIGGSTFAPTRQAKGTTRWMAPELLDLDDSETIPTMQSDVYSFGSIMLQIMTGNIPYHHLARDEQVIFAILKGTRPTRPDGGAITEHTWKFIEWCWSPVKGGKPRPSSNEIVGFTEKELVKIEAAEV